MSSIQIVLMLIPSMIIIVGWFVTDYRKHKFDVKEKQRVVRINHLINAYRVLSGWVHQAKLSDEKKSKIEDVVSDMQLLGSSKLINALNSVLKSWNENMGADIEVVLNILASELRKELNLDKVDYSKRKFFRFTKS